MRISLEEACELLRRGQVIAIPTETVYGLAACYTNEASVQNIFNLKKRPNDKPLSLLFSKFDQLHPLVEFFPEPFLRLKSFMPGPLTVVIQANCENVPSVVRAGSNTVGLRMPNHSLTLKLIDHVGPLAAPSANPSDAPPAINASEVETYFGADFPVLDGEECGLGEASTVIALRRDGFDVLRKGVITEDELQIALKDLKKTNPKK